ncbi:unnamed protein product [Blepharisma stoltei]|uniref:Rab-GAP TBC domain-containing protein n=1 Tax=Blepharisma stoltei TaxID=1481888 RepID=A0AAU9J3K6_9CILI|nr:unnamed protein product [Blepharisma stoltei]
MSIECYQVSKDYFNLNSYNLENLSKFFSAYTEITEDAAIKISKLTEEIKLSDNTSSLQSFFSDFSESLRLEASHQYNFAKTLKSLLIEPIEGFRENFANSYVHFINEGHSNAHSLSKAKKQLELNKNAYFKASVQAEKAQRVLELEDEFDRVTLASLNAEEMKNQAHKASEIYFSSMAEEKRHWGEYEALRKKICCALRDNEETRVQFIKKTIEKYLKSKSSFYQSLQADTAELTETINEVSPKDISSFESECLDLFKPFPQEKWAIYEDWKNDLKKLGQDPLAMEQGYISPGIGYVPMHTTLALIKEILHRLFPKKERKKSFSSSSSDSMSSSTDTEERINNHTIVSLTDVLLTTEGRRIFIQLLESKKSSPDLEIQHLQTLANFLTIILSSLMNEADCDYNLFYKIVVLSHIFRTAGVKKGYLFEHLSHHPIFQIRKMWSQTIECAINSKVLADNEAFHRARKRIRKNKVQPKNFKNSKFSVEKSEKNTATLLLNQFNFYMANLKVPLELARSIISESAQRTKVDEERRFSLMTELHAAQIEFYKKEFGKPKSLKKRSAERDEWGRFMPIGLSLQFLTKECYLPLMLVCKHWYSNLKLKIIKRALIEDLNDKVRLEAWTSILCKPGKISYTDLVNKLKVDKSSIEKVQDVIVMDILRSYPNDPIVDSEKLRNILQAYASYKPDVGYCQGMNFIAGTLFYVLRDEEKVFWCLSTMIQKFKMEELFSSNLSKLKLFFFTLDRFLAYLLPEVHKTFNAEMISSNHFASLWFITLFSGILNSKIEILLKIWDQFFYKGWKVIFKVSIALLTRISGHILHKKFEDILSLMSSLHGPFAKVNVFDNDLFKEMGYIKVTNQMIVQARKEYEKICEQMREK